MPWPNYGQFGDVWNFQPQTPPQYMMHGDKLLTRSVAPTGMGYQGEFQTYNYNLGDWAEVTPVTPAKGKPRPVRVQQAPAPLDIDAMIDDILQAEGDVPIPLDMGSALDSGGLDEVDAPQRIDPLALFSPYDSGRESDLRSEARYRGTMGTAGSMSFGELLRQQMDI